MHKTNNNYQYLKENVKINQRKGCNADGCTHTHTHTHTRANLNKINPDILTDVYILISAMRN